MNGLKYTGCIIFGLLAGILGTKKYFETKYKDISDAEIESVKNAFKNEAHANKKVEEPVKITKETSSLDKADFIIKKERYSSEENESEYYADNALAEEIIGTDIPYIIPPDEFGIIDGYETISLTYYADNILADENDVEVKDILKTVGPDALSSFGEYEDDSVFVRNEELKVDFEILLDERTFADVTGDFYVGGD